MVGELNYVQPRPPDSIFTARAPPMRPEAHAYGHKALNQMASVRLTTSPWPLLARGPVAPGFGAAPEAPFDAAGYFTTTDLKRMPQTARQRTWGEWQLSRDASKSYLEKYRANLLPKCTLKAETSPYW